MSPKYKVDKYVNFVKGIQNIKPLRKKWFIY